MFDQARRGSDGSQIDDVLGEMRRQAHDSADLASRFERLCQGVLGALSAGDGRRMFDRVDRWDDWAGRERSGGGIDLVAHRNSDHDDDAVAIGCHCYGDNRLISKRDVASFLTNSDSARFRARMLIHTAKALDPDLQHEIDDRQKPCHVVDLAEMRRWKLDWRALAETVGAVAPPHPSPGRATAAGQQGNTDPGSPAGSLLSRASRWLLSRGIGVAAIAAGTLMVFSGEDIGALLIIGGILVFARRHGTHRHTTPRPASRSPGRRHGNATFRHRPDSDDWSDDEPDEDDGWDLADEWDRVERREDEWEREDREFWAFSERDPAERGRRDRNDEWDTEDRWADTDDEWDADDGWDWDDDEPPRRPTSRGRGRQPFWETDDDYI